MEPRERISGRPYGCFAMVPLTITVVFPLVCLCL